MSKIYVPQQYSQVLSVHRSQFTPFWTADQGFAVWVLAGEDLSRGNVVTPLQAGIDGAVYKVPISGNNLDTPCGIVYADTYVGDLVPVVLMGIAYVLPVSSVTAARGYTMYCGTTEAGRAEQSAAIPAVTSHNRECGHWLDTGSGDGVLTRAIISHFN